MISHELAKELKDAGFPQQHIGHFIDSRGVQIVNWQIEEEVPKGFFYIPTLSELIEACALIEMYFGLEKHSNDWRAGTLKQGGMNHVSGSTPEEAVARLWLALNRTVSAKS